MVVDFLLFFPTEYEYITSIYLFVICSMHIFVQHSLVQSILCNIISGCRNIASEHYGYRDGHISHLLTIVPALTPLRRSLLLLVNKQHWTFLNISCCSQVIILLKKNQKPNLLRKFIIINEGTKNTKITITAVVAVLSSSCDSTQLRGLLE